MQSQQYISEKQASEIFGMSRAWFQRQRWLNLPPTFSKVGSRCLYKLEVLETFFNQFQKGEHHNV